VVLLDQLVTGDVPFEVRLNNVAPLFSLRPPPLRLAGVSLPPIQIWPVSAPIPVRLALARGFLRLPALLLVLFSSVLGGCSDACCR
jgi:hypothetical protein